MFTRKVEFTVPPHATKALEYAAKVIATRKFSGDGPFTKACEALLQSTAQSPRVFMVPSCTAALEMSMVIAGVGPGTEVIVPSFTFSSTANAAATLGATPVFVDIEPRSLNIDPSRMADAITAKTRAIVPVHYAGVACDMDAVMASANSAGITVIEDAAQCIGAKYKGRALGTIGRFGAMSFHETKNLGCGEGGAVFVRDDSDIGLGEIARDKGTNRRQFLRGTVDKYTWVGLGSSYLPSEMSSALLLAQLEEMADINSRRMKIWEFYRSAVIASPILRRVLEVAEIPNFAAHNAHIFYLISPGSEIRNRILKELRERHIYASSHYEPLHVSPAGRKYGRSVGPMNNSESLSQRLFRLPIYADLEQEAAEYAIHVLEDVVKLL